MPTYPLTLPTAPGPRRVRIELQTRVAMFAAPAPQLTTPGTVLSRRFIIELEFPPITEENRGDFQQFFDDLRGHRGTFDFDLDDYVFVDPAPGVMTFRMAGPEHAWDVDTARMYGFTLRAESDPFTDPGTGTPTLPATPGARSVRVGRYSATSQNLSPFTLTRQTYSWSGRRWRYEHVCPPLTETQAEIWHQFLYDCGGRAGVFDVDLDEYVDITPEPGVVSMRLRTESVAWEVGADRMHEIAFEAEEARPGTALVIPEAEELTELLPLEFGASRFNQLTVLPDGRILGAGDFGGGPPKKTLFVVNADGSGLVTSEDMNEDSGNEELSIRAALLHSNGWIYVVGRFELGDNSGIMRVNATTLEYDVTFGVAAIENGRWWCLLEEPDGSIVIGGRGVRVSGSSNVRIIRIDEDGVLDTSFLPTFVVGSGTAEVRSILRQSSGKLIAIGSFHTVAGEANHKGIVRFNTDDTVDTGFTVQAPFEAYATRGWLQSDDKIYVTGPFSTFGGSARVALVRLNSDGSVDTGFTSPFVDFQPFYAITDLIPLPDGKVMVLGGGEVQGPFRFGCMRLNADGTIDASWIGDYYSSQWGQPEQKMAREASGNIIVGGYHRSIAGGRAVYSLYQMTGGLIFEEDFRPILMDTATLMHTSDTAFMTAMAEQSTGKILVGADSVRYVNTVSGGRLFRLNADGTHDSGFAPAPNNSVRALRVIASDKVLVGGSFSTIGGGSHANIALLNSDGTQDSGFTASTNGLVRAIGVQSDNKIVLGGDFSQANSTSRTRLARLNSDGTLDSGFTATANNSVHYIWITSGGQICIAGDFTQVNSTSRSGFAVLNSDGTLFGSDVWTFGSYPRAFLELEDGQFLLGGAGIGCRLARFSASFVLDSGFDPDIISAQPSGPSSWGVGFLYELSNGDYFVGGPSGNASVSWLTHLRISPAGVIADWRWPVFAGEQNQSIRLTNGRYLFMNTAAAGPAMKVGPSRLSDDGVPEIFP